MIEMPPKVYRMFNNYIVLTRKQYNIAAITSNNSRMSRAQINQLLNRFNDVDVFIIDDIHPQLNALHNMLWERGIYKQPCSIPNAKLYTKFSTYN